MASQHFKSSSSSSGWLVSSFDGELFTSSAEIHQTILTQGLFSRQIGLSTAHALDNVRIAQFMKDNEELLGSEDVDEQRYPLLGICGNVGWELRTAIDLYLKPKGPFCKPTYLTSLSPERNKRLGENYEHLAEEERWLRWEALAGRDAVEHVDRATPYFRKLNAVLPRINEEHGFFSSVRPVLSAMDRDQLSNTSREVLDAMLIAMAAWNPEEGYQSRERLHEAVYNGNSPPRVWRGEVQPVSYDIDDLPTSEGWRFFVDALSNKHHADMHGLSIVTTPALRIPDELLNFIEPLPTDGAFEETVVRLPATVYAECLDLQFVIDLRRKREFWDSLSDLEGKEDKPAVFANHLTLISQEFAKHLIDVKKRPDLVNVSEATILTSYSDVIFTGATIGSIIGASLAMPLELAKDMLGFLKLIAPATTSIGGAGAIAHVLIKEFFSSHIVENPDFRDFMADLGEAGRGLLGG